MLHRSAWMVDAPDQRGKPTAADQVPRCNRQQILEEEAAPGQRLYRDAGLPCQFRIVLNLQGQQSSRDIIHIGNTVFKAADNKKADRQECAQSTASCAFCTQAAHYANADQYVAQNPQNHCSAKGK